MPAMPSPSLQERKALLFRLKRAINETGIANFDCIRSRAIDGFVDNAAKVALLTERDLTGRTSAAGQAKNTETSP